jgi:D-alanine-D-alanine ligase-like ATP-grasp enzyme
MQRCDDCGLEPTNHFFTWIESTDEVAIRSIKLSSGLQQITSAVFESTEKILGAVWPAISHVLEALHIISYGEDIERAGTPRSKAIWEEARRRGFNVKQLFVFGIPTELFKLQWGKVSYIFQSLPLPPTLKRRDSWPDDKQQLIEKLLEMNIAAPRAVSVKTLKEAHRALKEFGVVCVKPQVGSCGRHTSPYVRTAKELEHAFNSAKKLCYWVVVEEHIEGNLARATCVNGKLVAFLECVSPTVVGDGISTVNELITKQNNARPEHIGEIVMTPLHERYIARRGYTQDAVLEAGKNLPLIYSAGFGSGGSNWEYGTEINVELKDEIERAARLAGLPVVGFDLMLENPLKSPSEQKWGIIEANSLPWINLHSRPNQNNPQNVAGKIWDLWDNIEVPQKAAIVELV